MREIIDSWTSKLPSSTKAKEKGVKVSKSQPTWSRFVRLGVWLVFVASLFGALHLSGLDTTSTQSATVALGESSQVLLADPQPDGSGGGSTAQSNAASLQGGMLNRYIKDPIGLLPAYRWSQDTTLNQASQGIDLNVLNVQSGMNSISNMLFAFAGLMWSFLLMFLYWTMSISPLDYMIEGINKFFSALSDSLFSSGVVAVVIAVVFFAILKYAMKGNWSKILVTLMLFALPLGAMQVLATAAAKQQSGTSLDKATAPAYSPAWFAQKGNKMVNQVGSSLPSDVLSAKGPLANYNTPQTAASGEANCASYIAYLTANYKSAAAVSEGGSNANKSSIMPLVSAMWEKTFLDNWKKAEFSSSLEANYMYCMALESSNGKIVEGYEVVGGNIAKDGSASGARAPYNGYGPGPFILPSYLGAGSNWDTVLSLSPVLGKIKSWDQVTAEQIKQKFTLIWAACNKETARSPWDKGEEKITNEMCSGWAKAQINNESGMAAMQKIVDETKALNPQSAANLTTDTTKLMQEGGGANIAGATEMASVYTAYWGNNAGTRLTASLFAIIASVIFVWVFLGLCIGVLVAEFGFGLLLAMLPVSLLLAAFSHKQAGANQGLKLLKLTAGLGLSKLVLILVITMIVVITVFIQAVTANFPGSELIAMASPIIALLLLKMMANKMGFGNITSMGGAIGLTSAAATKAVGGKGLSDSIQKFSGKLGPKQAANGLKKHTYDPLKKGAGKMTQQEADRIRRKEKGQAPTFRDKMMNKAREGGWLGMIPASMGGSLGAKTKKHEEITTGPGQKEKEAKGQLNAAANGTDNGTTGALAGGLSLAEAVNAAKDPAVRAQLLAEAGVRGDKAAIAMLAGMELEGDASMLTLEQMAANAEIAAEKLGIPVEAIRGSALPIDPIAIMGENTGDFQAVIDPKTKAVDIEATWNALNRTAAFTPEIKASIEEAAAGISSLHGIGMDESMHICVEAAMSFVPPISSIIDISAIEQAVKNGIANAPQITQFAEINLGHLQGPEFTTALMDYSESVLSHINYHSGPAAQVRVQLDASNQTSRLALDPLEVLVDAQIPSMAAAQQIIPDLEDVRQQIKDAIASQHLSVATAQWALSPSKTRVIAQAELESADVDTSAVDRAFEQALQECSSIIGTANPHDKASAYRIQSIVNNLGSTYKDLLERGIEKNQSEAEAAIERTMSQAELNLRTQGRTAINGKSFVQPTQSTLF